MNGGSTTIWLSGKLHHKFAVVDNRTVNDDVLLVIESPLLAEHFTREVDRLWRCADLGITDGLRRQLDQKPQQVPQWGGAALILALRHSGGIPVGSGIGDAGSTWCFFGTYVLSA